MDVFENNKNNDNIKPFKNIKKHPRPLIKNNKDRQVKNFKNNENTLYIPNLYNEINTKDQGHSTWRYIIPISQMIYHNPNYYKKTKIPFVIYVNPLNNPYNTEKEIPIINKLNENILRCENCFAFINTYFEFKNNYKKYKCNICGLKGKNIDINISKNKDEIKYGSIEYLVNNKIYEIKKINVNILIIFIEESKIMIKKGVVGRIIETWKSILDLENLNLDLIFITFSDNLTIYKYEKYINKISENKILDINNPVSFYNLDSLKLNIVENKKEILFTLEYIEKRLYEKYEKNLIPTNLNFNLIFKFLYDFLEKNGGRNLIFISDEKCFPIDIKYDDEEIFLNKLKENHENLYFNNKDIIKNLIKFGIIIELFFFSYYDNNNLIIYQDLINNSHGNITLFDNYKDKINFEDLYFKIYYFFTKNVGFDVLNKIRYSKGFNLINYNLNNNIIFEKEFRLNYLYQNQIILIELELNSQLKEDYAYFQFVTIYNNIWDQRIIRIHNIQLKIINDENLFYKTISSEILLFKFIKDFLNNLKKNSLKTSRDLFLNNFIEILCKYRKYSNFYYEITELAIPKRLNYLPLNIYGFLLSNCFKKQNNYINILKNIVLINNFDIYTWLLNCYPKIYKLNYYEFLEGIEGTEYNNSILLPYCIPCNNILLNKENIYIIDNGIYIFWYILENVKDEFIQELFNKKNFFDWNENENLENWSNNLNIKLNKIINHLRYKKHGNYQSCYVIKENSKNEEIVKKLFIENQSIEESKSYWKFLNLIHHKIKDSLKF